MIENLFIKVREPLTHGGLYVYSADSRQLEEFEPAPESWAAWAGRRTADGTFYVALYYLLKWMGVIVHVTVAS